MSLLDALRHRVRTFVRGDAYAREQADELRAHLELDAMHRAHGGASIDDAHAAARRRLGNLTNVREDARRAAGFAWADRAKQDVGYALRGLRQSPGFTAMVVLTIALGVGANTAIFSFLDRVYLRTPEGVSDASSLRRMYTAYPSRLTERGEPMVSGFFSYDRFELLQRIGDHVASATIYTDPLPTRLGSAETDVRVRRAYVDHNYFSVLGVRAARGRFFGETESRLDVPTPVAVISHALWQREFASDSAIIGRDIDVGRRRFTVIGVTAAGFSGLSLDRTDVFLPLSMFEGRGQMGRPWYQGPGQGNYFRAITRLAPGVDARTLDARATAEYLRPDPERRIDTTAYVASGSVIQARGLENTAQELTIATRIGGVTFIVLAIACANIANLLLVRSTKRRREIALRLALGVSRARLAAQLLTESLVLAGIGAVAAIAIATWGSVVLREALLPGSEWAGSAFSIRTMLVAAGTALLTGVFAGLAPALQSRNVDLNAALKSPVTRAGSHRSVARASLLVLQTALSVVLLVGAGLFVRSLGKVESIPLGYAADELLFASVTFADQRAHTTELAVALPEAARRLAGVPGVAGAATSSTTPMWSSAMLSVFLPGSDSAYRPYPYYNSVSPEFFHTTDMRIISGRALTREDAADSSGNIVVNAEMAATIWPRQNPIGQCLQLRRASTQCYYVVGVAANARHNQIIEREQRMHYFVPHSPNPAATTFAPSVLIVRANRAHMPRIREAMSAELRRLLPGVETVRVDAMTDNLARQYRPWKLGANLFMVFGLLALVVAAIGVYSVISYSVSQRTQEMGVRIALGARAGSLLRLVTGEGVRVLGVGVAIGIGLAIALSKLVASLLYGVSPRDPLALAVAGGVLVAVGIVACLVPAWRASRVDPIKALRTE